MKRVDSSSSSIPIVVVAAATPFLDKQFSIYCFSSCKFWKGSAYWESSPHQKTQIISLLAKEKKEKKEKKIKQKKGKQSHKKEEQTENKDKIRRHKNLLALSG